MVPTVENIRQYNRPGSRSSRWGEAASEADQPETLDSGEVATGRSELAA